MKFATLYPDGLGRTAEWIIQAAQDQLANDYMERNFDADPAAVAENSRLRPDDLLEAMEILEHAGAVTFTAEAHRDAEAWDA